MLNSKFKEVMKNLEKNITNPHDLDYAKSQITELTVAYLEKLEELEVSNEDKFNMCEKRLMDLENCLNRLEQEIMEEIDDDTDLEPIQCPYCNINFFIEFDETKKEVRCPDCQNMIELDWGNFEDDM